MSKREPYGDALRLVATILVVLLHCLITTKAFALSNQSSPVLSYIPTLLDSLTRAAVPIFFMLTGAFAFKKAANYRSFLVKIITRLAIPTLLFSIVAYIYFHRVNGTTMSILNFFSQLSSLPGTGYYLWFMYALLLIYPAIPYLYKMIAKLSRTDLRNLIIIIFILGSTPFTINTIAASFGKTVLSGFCLPDLIIYINYMFIGYYIRHFAISRSKRMLFYYLGTASLLLLPLLEMILPGKELLYYDRLCLAQSVFPFFMSTALFMAIKSSSWINKLPKIASKSVFCISSISFYIYMIHVIIMEIIIKQFSLMTSSSIPILLINSFVVFVATFTLSIIVGSIFDIVYKRMVRVIDSALMSCHRERQ